MGEKVKLVTGELTYQKIAMNRNTRRNNKNFKKVIYYLGVFNYSDHNFLRLFRRILESLIVKLKDLYLWLSLTEYS